MEKHLVQRAILLLVLIALFSSCTAAYRPASKVLDLTVTLTRPIIVYDKAEVYGAIADSPWEAAQKVSECSSSDIPLWSIHRTLRDYRPHRALALGFPYDCGGSWHAWSYESKAGAAAAALGNCLIYMKGLEKHTGFRCGARLVMVDQDLLVSAEELPAKRRFPFIMEATPLMDKKFPFCGMFESEGPGQNRRLEVFNDKGKKVCVGEYSLSYLQAFLGSGDFELNCFDGQLTGEGSFSVEKINLRHVSGEAQVAIGKGRTSDGGKFRFLTGITIDQYEMYKDLLE